MHILYMYMDMCTGENVHVYFTMCTGCPPASCCVQPSQPSPHSWPAPWHADTGSWCIHLLFLLWGDPLASPHHDATIPAVGKQTHCTCRCMFTGGRRSVIYCVCMRKQRSDLMKSRTVNVVDVCVNFVW